MDLVELIMVDLFLMEMVAEEARVQIHRHLEMELVVHGGFYIAIEEFPVRISLECLGILAVRIIHHLEDSVLDIPVSRRNRRPNNALVWLELRDSRHLIGTDSGNIGRGEIGSTRIGPRFQTGPENIRGIVDSWK